MGQTGLRDCCADKSNREKVYEMNVDEQGEGPEMSRLIEVCKICDRRHFTIKAEPGVIGIELSPLGGLPDGIV